MKTGSLDACNRDSRGAPATRRPVASTTALALALLTGCARDTMPVVSERPSHPLHFAPPDHQLLYVEPDPAPPFRLDRSRPFLIRLDQGNGWVGYDAVVVSDDGLAVIRRRLHRLGHRWGSAVVRFAPREVDALVEGVESTGVMGLAREYETTVRDGTCWRVGIHQGNRHKSVWCNNHVPAELARFAERLNTALDRAHLDRAPWRTPADPPQPFDWVKPTPSVARLYLDGRCAPGVADSLVAHLGPVSPVPTFAYEFPPDGDLGSVSTTVFVIWKLDGDRPIELYEISAPDRIIVPGAAIDLGDLPWGVHAIAHPSGQRSDGIEPLPKGTYRATLAVAGVRGCGMARVKFTVE